MTSKRGRRASAVRITTGASSRPPVAAGRATKAIGARPLSPPRAISRSDAVAAGTASQRIRETARIRVDAGPLAVRRLELLPQLDPGVDATCHGRMSQNAGVAMVLAFLLSADVPGVNCALSPLLLNDAACCWAVWMALEFVPQYADSHAANEPLEGTLPNADAFSSAASSCCRSCILDWSRAVRFLPVDVLEMSLQKPPISLARVSMFRQQSSVSPMPGVFAAPGKV